MIKDFKGQVKVSDIQAAFDEIVDRINKQVDIYNDAAGYADIDYTKGSPKLSNAGYTLTIGGLKSVIDAYNGTLIGCKAYKLSDTAVLVSDGLYFKDGQVYRINSRVVSGEEGWDLNDLYYDIDNNTVIFKDGVSSEVVEVQTGWVQPTITSNTSCGIFAASSNSQDAYKITTNEGFNVTWQGSGQFAYPTVVWNLPKKIKVSNISLNTSATVFIGSATIIIKCDDEEVYRGNSGNLNINLNNRETQSVTIYAQIPNDIYGFSVSFKNLIITGNANSYAIDAGGVVTPSDNIIKLTHLNWASGNLVLNSIEGFQLENTKDVKLVSQNKRVRAEGGANVVDSWSNSNNGNFVAYTSRFYNGNGTSGGSTSFMGLQLTGGYGDSGGGRNHWGSTALSLIYIPKGFTPTDSISGFAGRNVYKSNLIK